MLGDCRHDTRPHSASRPAPPALKEIAEQRGWSLSEVMRKAAEQFVTRISEGPKPTNAWRFPTLDCDGDFLTDPAGLHPEADVVLERGTR